MSDLNLTSLFPMKICNRGKKKLLCTMQPGHSYAQEEMRLLVVSIFQNHRKQPTDNMSIY